MPSFPKVRLPNRPALPSMPAGPVNTGNVKGFWDSPFVNTVTKMIGMLMHGKVDASESYSETQTDHDEFRLEPMVVGRINFGGLYASSNQTKVLSGNRSVKAEPVNEEETSDSDQGNSKYSRKRGFFG